MLREFGYQTVVMRRINIKVVPRDEGSFVADQDWYIVRPPDGSDGEGSDSDDQRQ
jgi:hypothetical protein